MADLRKKVLGSVSGALGDIVFREMNGKNVVGVKASSYKLPLDPASVARRAKFKMAIKLARAINLNAKLKSLWKPQAPAGLNAFNFLIKTNYFYVSPDTPGNFILLTPGGGFPFSVESVEKTSELVRVRINPIGNNSGIDKNVEVKIQMLSVLFMSNPAGENVPSYRFLTLSSGINDLSLTEPLDFTTQLSGSESLIYEEYQEHKVYFALVTLDADVKVIHHSISQNG